MTLCGFVRLRAATASRALVSCAKLCVAGPLMEGPVPIKMALIVDLFSEQQALGGSQSEAARRRLCRGGNDADAGTVLGDCG